MFGEIAKLIGKHDKVLEKIEQAKFDANFAFDDF